MTTAGKQIRKLVQSLEREAATAAELREWALSDGGRLTAFGVELIELAKEHEIPQSVMARVLNLSASAISRRYNS